MSLPCSKGPRTVEAVTSLAVGPRNEPMAQLDDVVARGAVRAPWGPSLLSRRSGVTLSALGAAHVVVDAVSAAAVVGILATSPASPQTIVG